MVRSEATAEDSFAAILARSKFGMAMAAMIRMIATTISNSIREKPRCFSLIELLIVVAIILIIAAIAIPNLLRAKIAANESSAVASLRTINTAEVTYSSSWGAGYA